MGKVSKKWAIFVAAAVLCSQLVLVFHAHEAHAAAKEVPCSVCHAGQDLNTFDAVEPSTIPISLESIDSDVPETESLTPRQPLLDFAPRVPPFVISL